MRPIKFRMWDSKQMIPVGSIDFFVDGSFNVNDEFPVGNKALPYNLMQFTGLLDKNGKEIYEGDVVKSGDPYFTEEVTLEVVMHHEDYPGTIMALSEYNRCPLADLAPKHVEVIGDIYENPELLK